MENNLIVRPEYLNQYGYLFGGYLLKWVDEFAWLSAIDDFPDCILVTVGLDNVVFKEKIVNGSILHFQSKVAKKGNTSLTYEVDVWGKVPADRSNKKVFSTNITFVCIDKDGNKTPIKERL